MKREDTSGNDDVREQYDEVASRFEEGMARMAVYHRHCQDPVIFRTLGNIRGKSLLDLACGNGYYTRRFSTELGANPVIGVDLSPMLIEQAEAAEQRKPLGIEYHIGDVTKLELARRFDVVTAIHLLHYLPNGEAVEAALHRIHALLQPKCTFVTMIANPEFDLARHDPEDSKQKFGYYFSDAQDGNGGLLRFHPGGFEKERELTFELRRWERSFLDDVARRVGFAPEWHDPFISAEGIAKYGVDYFANYLPNPQSKLLRLTRV